MCSLSLEDMATGGSLTCSIHCFNRGTGQSESRPMFLCCPPIYFVLVLWLCVFFPFNLCLTELPLMLPLLFYDAALCEIHILTLLFLRFFIITHIQLGHKQHGQIQLGHIQFGLIQHGHAQLVTHGLHTYNLVTYNLDTYRLET